jgi:hypothetical protein
MTYTPYRRYPRKLKKTFIKVNVDFTEAEFSKIRLAAREKGMRPTQFVCYALQHAIERSENEQKI